MGSGGIAGDGGVLLLDCLVERGELGSERGKTENRAVNGSKTDIKERNRVLERDASRADSVSEGEFR